SHHRRTSCTGWRARGASDWSRHRWRRRVTDRAGSGPCLTLPAIRTCTEPKSDLRLRAGASAPERVLRRRRNSRSRGYTPPVRFTRVSLRVLTLVGVLAAAPRADQTDDYIKTRMSEFHLPGLSL